MIVYQVSELHPVSFGFKSQREMEGQKQSSQVQTPRKDLGDTKADDTGNFYQNRFKSL